MKSESLFTLYVCADP